MSVEAEQLEDWVGSEVVDADGAKLGKVAEVFYRGPDPMIVEIRSGIIGHKLSLAALAGATVSMKHLRLSVAETIPTDGGVSAEELGRLASQDPRLSDVTVDQLESGSDRQARIAEAADAARNATALEGEAANRQEEAKIAAKVAREATDHAVAAEQASVNAKEQATAARQRADELQAAL